METTQYTVLVSIESTKPIRRVAVGVFGPGIATIVRVEAAPESIRPAAPVRALEVAS